MQSWLGVPKSSGPCGRHPSGKAPRSTCPPTAPPRRVDNFCQAVGPPHADPDAQGRKDVHHIALFRHGAAADSGSCLCQGGVGVQNVQSLRGYLLCTPQCFGVSSIIRAAVHQHGVAVPLGETSPFPQNLEVSHVQRQHVEKTSAVGDAIYHEKAAVAKILSVSALQASRDSVPPMPPQLYGGKGGCKNAAQDRDANAVP